ncbi:cysteine synthase A [Sedimentisphaera salicampi]|uniref:Cysteine synthase n=1 Tax=Sedimentisphaera salicampi TaxID=1941349 RepID=A0A1W6LJY2_9BACT|nr:cysteine synthase A [Sedimentisphaera salicampi]ARN56110.1 Cysteine synthase [Sedimentisphaera salicampi]OXU15842.1 Cysteine synthase [Sedimentisphaera salicampi]
MAEYRENITETIGNTPLVELKGLGDFNGRIFGKCEFFNPCGSVKDRIALYMINEAEKSGKITPETVIIEPTSGNTGIGLAFICASRGYRLMLTMPESMSIERRKLLHMLGAEIVLTEASAGMKGAVQRAEELAEEHKPSFIPQQFNNPANPKAHRETTALEIERDLGEGIDYFVAGVGTGGTITGCSEYLKEKNKEMISVAVEPEGSPVLSGGKPGPHRIQGIGAGFVPDVLNRSVIDRVVKVNEQQAVETAKLLAKKEGILVGISAGANVFASMQVAQEPEAKGKNIVTILCDTGERYISTELFS